MELVTSQCNTLFSSLFWGQEASEEMNEIKLLLICTNNYSEKFLIDEISKIRQTKMGGCTPLAGSLLIIASSEFKGSFVI